MRNNKESGFGAALIFIILFVVAAIIISGLYISLRRNRESQQTQTTPTKLIATFNENNRREIGTSGVSYVLPNEWTEQTSAKGNYLDIFTYNPNKVADELRSDGRMPNANFYDDVKERGIHSYPFSLDKIYEIQVNVGPGKKLSEEEVKSIDRSVENYSNESLGGKDVSDYLYQISGSKKQRSIQFNINNQYVGLIINREESRAVINKDNFDGLEEFIRLIK